MSSVRGPVMAGKRSRRRRDDRARLVDRERRLREVGDPRRVVDLERVDVLLGLDQHDRSGRLAHRALDLLVAGVADEHDRVALGGELDRLAVDLGDERAGRVDRPQAARSASACTAGETPWAEKTVIAPSGIASLELVDEDRAALRELLDDVLVVDDLLAHVDRRAVQLERALDGLHRAVDAGAVAARRGEQELLGGGRHYRPECTKELQRAVSPVRSSERSLTAERSSQRSCQHAYGQSIRSIAGTPRARNGVWSSVIAAAASRAGTRRRRRRAGRARAARLHSSGSELASRGMRRSLAATKSSRTSAPISSPWRLA